MLLEVQVFWSIPVCCICNILIFLNVNLGLEARHKDLSTWELSSTKLKEDSRRKANGNVSEYVSKQVGMEGLVS